MIAYLTQSILCMAFLLAIYFVLLEKEKMYRFNRFYLLLSLIFSVLIPFVSYTVYTEVAPVEQVESVLQSNNNIGVAATQPIPAQEEPPTNYLIPLLISTYALGVGFFLIRFIRNIFVILLAVRKYQQIAYQGATLILTDAPLSNFTFFHYIFVNGSDYNSQRIEKELLSHELAHARQLHSLDVVLVEILLIVCWFNPLLILYKRAIQLNHEYLADEAVLSVYHDPKQYQILLLSRVELFSMPLANSFNYLITKKRLTMMTKNFSKTRAACKQLATLPLAALAVFLFSTRVEAQIETPSTDATKQDKIKLEKRDTNVVTPLRSEKKTVKVIKAEKSPVAQSSPALQPADKAIPKGVEQANVPKPEQEPVPMGFVEVMPDFRGGMEKFKTFIVSNTAHSGTSGTVEATFYIEKDGSLIVSGLPNGSDNKNARALMKTLEGSPFWLPGIQNGRPVKVAYAMTVSFKEEQSITVDKISAINEEMVVSFEKSASDGRVFVQGLVLDKDGQPLAGVSIRTADYKNLGVSGKSGRFALALPDAKPLVFSNIGYATKKIGL